MAKGRTKTTQRECALHVSRKKKKWSSLTDRLHHVEHCIESMLQNYWRKWGETSLKLKESSLKKKTGKLLATEKNENAVLEVSIIKINPLSTKRILQQTSELVLKYLNHSP